MSVIKDGGPAFPASKKTGMGSFESGVFRAEFEDSGGMSLRDWFAGQALPQVMAIYAVANGHMIGTDHFPRNCAAHAYSIAEEMIEQKRLRETRP